MPVFLIFALILSVFLYFRWLRLMPWKRPYKVIAMVIILLGAFKFQLFHLFGGGLFFAPLLPRPLLILGGFLFCSLLLLTVFTLLADIVVLGIRGIHRLRGHRWSFPYGTHVRYVCLALALLLSGIGVHNTLVVPEVREITMEFDRVPDELKGIRIAVLADLHADNVNNQEKIRAIVEKTNALNPDLILIAGDFVDGHVADQAEALLPLQDLHAEHGVYAVPGNHDYYSGFAEWMDYLRQRGIRMLLNEHVDLFEGLLALGGVTDPAAYREGQGGLEGPDVAKAFNGAPEGSFRLLLAHQPIIAQEAQAQGVDLQLSGHTHGGMIPILRPFVARGNQGMVSGRYDRPPLTVYVSNGTCLWNGFPVRLGVPAEITLLTL